MSSGFTHSRRLRPSASSSSTPNSEVSPALLPRLLCITISAFLLWAAASLLLPRFPFLITDGAIPDSDDTAIPFNLTRSASPSFVDIDIEETHHRPQLDLMLASAENQIPVIEPKPNSAANSSAFLEIMADLRRTGSNLVNNDCDGRRVFIYDLPERFNIGLLRRCSEILPWIDLCDYFTNAGMGKEIRSAKRKKIKKPGNGNGSGGLNADVLNDGDGETPLLVPEGRWYQTHQYSLEMIFHEKMKHYDCLTKDSDAANLFYIPYYGGIDVLRWHFAKNVSDKERDALPLQLSQWLWESPAWRRNGGVDHVLVLGKISWDFRRRSSDGGGTSAPAAWGNHLLLLPEIRPINRILIERDPWDSNDAGVPHPTFFHPGSVSDLRQWQTRVAGFERKYLVSFAGMPRPNQKESIRTELIRQCLAHEAVEKGGKPATPYGNGTTAEGGGCYFLRCSGETCLQPETIMSLFAHSEFCLQPAGDSPTRRSIFDALIGGCIPVLFDPMSAYYQYPWHLPEEGGRYSVYIEAERVRKGEVEVVRELGKVGERERKEMRRRIVEEIMPGLLYAAPKEWGMEQEGVEDAFQITVRSLLGRIRRRLAARKAA